MEALSININIGFNADTLSAIKALGAVINNRQPSPAQAASPKTAGDEAPAQAQTAAPAAAANKTAQEAQSDHPKNYTDAELRAAVKGAKDRTSAQSVKDVFAKFNITSSIQCPADQREALMQALENLR